MTPRIATTLLRSQTDARLLSLAGKGYEPAFEAIVERYRRPLERYCGRILGHAQAEDAVQQAFVNAWSALRRGVEVRDLRPWLYRIAHNSALRLVVAGREETLDSVDGFAVGEGADARAETRATAMSALAAVGGLPERQRRVLVGTALEGRSRSELAASLGLTDGAVRQLVHRARAAVRTAVTAVTPVRWLSRSLDSAGRLAERAPEVAATGTSAAGLAGAALKIGATVAAAGAVAAAPVAVIEDGDRPRPAPAPGEATQDASRASSRPLAGALDDGVRRLESVVGRVVDRASAPLPPDGGPAGVGDGPDVVDQPPEGSADEGLDSSNGDSGPADTANADDSEDTEGDGLDNATEEPADGDNALDRNEIGTAEVVDSNGGTWWKANSSVPQSIEAGDSTSGVVEPEPAPAESAP